LKNKNSDIFYINICDVNQMPLAGCTVFKYFNVASAETFYFV